MRYTLRTIGDHVWLAGPLAVCLSATVLVAHLTQRPVSVPGVIVLFFGVIAAYALDHWVDQPPGHRSPNLLGLVIIATCTVIVTSLGLPFWKFLLTLSLGIAGLAYRRCKKWPLGKTFLVALGWTAAAVAYPVQWGAQDLFLAPFASILLALFAANALLCDLKDVQADARAGVPTAVVLWGRKRAILAAISLALVGLVVALATRRIGLACACLAMITLAAFPQIISRPVLGPALADAALLLPAVLILAGWA